MSLQPSSRHPLGGISRSTSPTGPGYQSTSFPFHGAASSSSGHLTPSADASVSGTPPRSHSPMLTSRRRRNQLTNDAGGPASGTLALDQDDEYDAKRRGPEAGPSRPRGTTLDRLESFFGIDSGMEANRSLSPAKATYSRDRGTAAPMKPSSSSTGSPGTRLVLQHTVLATDTLQGIALRYKTDVPTIRKVNGLWPGDSALSRKIIWVPLDRCKEQLTVNPDARVGVQGADGGSVTEAASSLLGLSPPSEPSAHSGVASSPLHERTLPSTGASEISDLSSSNGLPTNGGGDSPPVVRRLPSEALGHFPATARSDILAAKGKTRADQWNEELTSARSQNRLGAGPGMSGYDPGESGVEDLLQLAREARGTGENSETPRGPAFKLSLPEDIKPEESRSEVSSSSAAEKDEWKPNVWKFGEKKRSGAAGGSTLDEGSRRDSLESSASNLASGSNNASTSPQRALRPLKLVDKSIEEWEASSNVGKPSGSRGDATSATSPGSSSSGYAGWNDIPSLDAYAKGKVVEAYGGSGKGANGKRRAARANHRFFDDLAAGLPPNSGAASKWARPIGESLPGATTQKASSSSNGPSLSSAAPAGKKSSLRGLLSDALRGRVALDEALAKGFEEVLNRSESWDSLPQEEMEQARRLGLLPPSGQASPSLRGPPSRFNPLPPMYSDRPRISAEEARRTLGRRQSPEGSNHVPQAMPEGHSGSSVLPPTTADSQQRRAQMEMESLDANHHSRRNVYNVPAVEGGGIEGSRGGSLAPPSGSGVGPMLRKTSNRNLATANGSGSGRGADGVEGKWGW
ncbi:hypothetical protein BCV69DRAFT_282357 [Microstroma glucosiphilum]|uniref:LysM domain-containing protein n=1 Tax=Pseudomicrostroma glucosiphilum TaxID=1684307 RepID=A0A316U8X9_9BASI|nr:hypothetical protein BCV69DRAFT_282357 [Pseudomicrostroma glucosiphilum]PWN21639.1 hypothetical protein BCV69DRAFT_282357 [Pseudomicrostroma glucosiphilum]